MKKDIKMSFVAGAAFGLGLLLGFIVTVTITPKPVVDQIQFKALYDDCVTDMFNMLVPTATPHVCPELPEPCPTVLYKVLPDVTGVLSDLGLVDYEMSLVDTKLENFITSTEGEFDWQLVGILSLHRSSHNYLLDAAEEVIMWFNLGELTCPK